jgi:hypothetical protein
MSRRRGMTERSSKRWGALLALAASLFVAACPPPTPKPYEKGTLGSAIDGDPCSDSPDCQSPIYWDEKYPREWELVGKKCALRGSGICVLPSGGGVGRCQYRSACTSAQRCLNGQCCTPNCSGKRCGSDGCGGLCGTCQAGFHCNAAFQCQRDSVPNCGDRKCGPDGLGGSCGTCQAGFHCNAAFQCERDCVPKCAGKQCGPDGCGGSCGRCTPPEFCDASGQCTCTPICDGYCGEPDGCGGTCSDCRTCICPEGERCEANRCVSGGGVECRNDRDCGAGECCEGKRCIPCMQPR